MTGYYEVITNLLKEIEEVEIDILDIKFQIDTAKDKRRISGEFADSEWYRKANYALNKKQNRLKALQRQFSEIKKLDAKKEKEQKVSEQKELEKCFMDICANKLKPETFQKLLRMSEKLMEDRKKGHNLKYIK